MSGHLKFYALGAASLVFGAFQAPRFAAAVPQFTPLKPPKATKATADQQVKAGAEFVDPAKTENMQDVSGSPVQDESATSAPKRPSAATVAELVSFFGVEVTPVVPFEDAARMEARSAQPPLSCEALRQAAARRTGFQAVHGRRAKVKGTVFAINPVGAKMRQILIAKQNDPARVAFLVTLPRGDDRLLMVGMPVELTAVAGAIAWKPGSKGTLVSMLGGGLDQWRDEDMSLTMIGFIYLRPNPRVPSEPAQPDHLGGWHFRGQVAGEDAGTSLATNRDGRVLYLRDGQLVEPGLRVLKVQSDSVLIRLDNHPVTVRPW